MKLFHYCCDCSAQGIGFSGVLEPNAHPMLNTPVVWLTDLETPDRAALGLTSDYLDCDRTKWRVTVETDRAKRWLTHAALYATPSAIHALEAGGQRLPAHWWVSAKPLPIETIELTGAVPA